jgi:hypothetical protein
MRDKYLVAVVRPIIVFKKFHLAENMLTVQLKASQYAWCEELCDGSLRRFIPFDDTFLKTSSLHVHLQATSKEGKDGGIELIQPPPGSQPGDRVYFEGQEFES